MNLQISKLRATANVAQYRYLQALSIDQASGGLGVQIQAATDTSRKNGSWQLHC